MYTEDVICWGRNPNLRGLERVMFFDEKGGVVEDMVVEKFYLDALSKVYKINNVCGPDKLSSCGVPSKITTLGAVSEINFPTKMSELNEKLLSDYYIDGESGNMADTKAAAFETVNGESLAVFYNPSCGVDDTVHQYAQNKMCVNMIYDLNGEEGPNEVGKDVGFITAFYRKNPVVVAPVPYKTNASDAVSYSDSEDVLDAAFACKIQGENLRLPNKYEVAALFINQELVLINADKFWSGTVVSLGSHGLAWAQDFTYGNLGVTQRDTKFHVRCIQR